MQSICAASPHLVRIAARFTGAAYVAHRRLFHEADFIAAFAQPKAKIGLLTIKKKLWIKSPKLRIDLAADNHAGSDNPGDLAGKSREIFANMRFVGISRRRSLPLARRGCHSAASHPPGFVLRKDPAKCRQSVWADELCVRIQKINIASFAGAETLVACPAKTHILPVFD